MLCFPNAKINLGLNIVEKRTDGFHNLQTVFYPVPLCDVLEFVEVSGESNSRLIRNTGTEAATEPSENLCVKAYELLKKDFNMPAISIHLHKIIPVGAGLGGGSSDAAYMLTGLNRYFNLGLSTNNLQAYASQLGSDCAFFIQNKPSYAWEKGDKMHEIQVNLKNLEIVLIYPHIHISTAKAYATIKPSKPSRSPEAVVQLPVEEWEPLLTNDFESFVFKEYPEIKVIKQKLYDLNAVYAAMTGSGSAVFGLFHTLPENITEQFAGYFVWEGKL